MQRAGTQWRRYFHATRVAEGGKTSLKTGRWQDRLKKRAAEEVKELPLRVGAIEYVDRLKRCHGEMGLIWADIIHQRILCARREQERETYLGNILVQTYGRCGSPEKALEAFAAIADKNIHSWTIMMGALQVNDKHEEVLDIFGQLVKQVKSSSKTTKYGMVKPVNVEIVLGQATYVTVLRSCSVLGDVGLKKGQEIHIMCLKEGWGEDLVVQNALITMYAKCGKFKFANEVFKRMKTRNVISYTAMMYAYTHEGMDAKAYELYKTMLREGIFPDVYAYAAVLAVCPTVEVVSFIHGKLNQIERRTIAAHTALISAYSRFGRVVEAEMVFDRVRFHKRKISTFNAMIGAYARLGEPKKAIELFVEMEANAERVKPDTRTYTELIIASAKIGAIAEGRDAHARILDRNDGVNQNVELKNALVEMYARCGFMESAEKIFNGMKWRDSGSYLGLLSAYSRPGKHDKYSRLELYYSMYQEGVPPRNGSEFSSVFEACKHTGAPDEGWKYFITMVGDVGVSPLPDHYHCMVELLVRVGKLEDARELIVTMPYEPDSGVWSTLLSGCKHYGAVKLGVEAARRAFQADPFDVVPHVLLAGLYAKVGKKREQLEVVRNMVKLGLNPLRGKCTIEANRQINEFVSGDVFHPLNNEVRDELRRLHKSMVDEGYQVDVPGEVAFEDQEHHCERMAIGLGVVLTDATYPLIVVKNSRMCPDCHRAVKFMGKMLRRHIIVRDPGRVHWFSRGCCSCGDFW